MRTLHRGLIVLFAFSTFAAAQAKPDVTAQSTSTFNYSKETDGSENINIRNVSFEMVDLFERGKAGNQSLLLRKTTASKRTAGDIGEEATITLEAWPLGTDLKQKPLFTVSTTGTDGHTLDNALFVASRGTEEVDWWSVYKLKNGQHLFDTYLPLVSFSISRETVETRYLGLQVPEDEVKDARLKKPGVVVVLTYASAAKIIREILITADDAKQAAQLRSLADETRTLTALDSSKGKAPSYSLHLTFSQTYPSPPNLSEIVIPVMKDDLDLANAKLPAGIHAAAFSR
ncbi:hypothetical protein Acid345_4534 [Candidatus Koribacter versatilis Ellin345]|uniref:Uncharacterized protein n=1 Tax=Koribacter versatilis (strain Ellin345) TaxID=204669 RepID=Q1IHW6_KORVE|nr:hypothetical protein [Candidatus Koribacter versatilis]ABF43534.1 hypothetical protein Acid345_4534 [Candidatus Koribacter versatilis Ellin345]